MLTTWREDLQEIRNPARTSHQEDKPISLGDFHVKRFLVLGDRRRRQPVAGRPVHGRGRANRNNTGFTEFTQIASKQPACRSGAALPNDGTSNCISRCGFEQDRRLYRHEASGPHVRPGCSHLSNSGSMRSRWQGVKPDMPRFVSIAAKVAISVPLSSAGICSGTTGPAAGHRPPWDGSRCWRRGPFDQPSRTPQSLPSVRAS